MEECRGLMEQNQVRRVPVVDEQGMICGIVSQADIARSAKARDTGHLVQRSRNRRVSLLAFRSHETPALRRANLKDPICG